MLAIVVELFETLALAKVRKGGGCKTCTDAA